MTTLPKKQIAAEFARLSERLNEYWRRSKKPLQLAIDLQDSEIQAGRLLIAAIDLDAFPKARAAENGGWWDRSIGRVPGGVLTLFGGHVTIKDSKSSPGVKSSAAPGVSKNWTEKQFHICWKFAVGWLVKSFPESFRGNATQWDWSRVATDRQGRVLKKDRKPYRERFYRDGKALPRSVGPYEVHNPDSGLPPGNYTSKPNGEIAWVTDFYDDEDRMEHLRRRAEVHSAACRLLAERITPPPPDALGNVGSGLLVSQIAEKICLSNTTLLRYAKNAGVRTPRRGEKDFRYPIADAIRILQQVIDESTVAVHRANCQTWLPDLKKIK